MKNEVFLDTSYALALSVKKVTHVPGNAGGSLYICIKHMQLSGQQRKQL